MIRQKMMALCRTQTSSWTGVFFGHFVFLSLYRDVTLRQFMLRNHHKATEIYYLKNHGYSSSKITRVVFGIGYSQVLEYPWQPYP